MKLPVFLLALCVAGAAHAQATGANEQLVLVGVAAPLTSPRTESGIAAVRLAFDDANRRAIRIGGKQLVFRLLVEDDKGDALFAVPIAQYFIRSKVVGVIGHWNSGPSIAVAELYNAAGIPQIPIATTSSRFTREGLRTTFQVQGHDGVGAIRLADFVVRNLQAARIAVIEDGTTYGTDFADSFVSGVRRAGGNVVSREAISSKTSDFNPALANVQKINADVIVFGGVVTQSALLARSMLRRNMSIRLVATGGTATGLFLQLAQGVERNVWALETGAPRERLSGWREFNEKMRAHFKGEISHYALFAYDAANVLIAAIQKSGSLDPKAITIALHDIRYPGLTGIVSFDANGALINPAYTIYRLEQGKWSVEKVLLEK
jgi:branched-chain amino acid transport system substrate-binding protein